MCMHIQDGHNRRAGGHGEAAEAVEGLLGAQDPCRAPARLRGERQGCLQPAEVLGSH